MADTLLIYFNPAQAATATWSLVNATGELTSMITSGALSDAEPIAAKHKTVVLLDSTSVHLNTARLPIKNHQKLLRAAPYALEEKIADDVDDLHFVASKPDGNGEAAIASIRHDTLKHIINVFNNAGIEPSAILPDALCLTASATQWAILLNNEQASVQFDLLNGSKLDLDHLTLVLAAELENETRVIPEKIILFVPGNTTEATSAETIRSLLPATTELIMVSYNTHPLVVYCGQYQNAMPLNLLQESYKPRSKSSIEWQRWRLAASLAVLLLGLHLGSASTQYYGLQNENDMLRVQIEKIYKTTFPESSKIVNARVQMEQKLNELKGSGSTADGADMVALLSDSADALASEKDITLQAINYRNNKMDLEITSTNLQAIESLNKKLNHNNIQSEIVSSSSEKNLVKGSVRIQKAGL